MSSSHSEASTGFDRVRSYYDAFGEQEWMRLMRPDDGAVEFAVTRRLLARHLPASGRVLCIGGGPGRYAFWLAECGYAVTLADLSPELLAIAREKQADVARARRIDAIVEANATDLSRWSDESFDAVLCLGPFYHLPELTDRDRAASEILRVLKPGGIAVIALMPVLTFLKRTMVLPDEQPQLLDDEWVDRLLRHGRFDNAVPGRFDYGYGVNPQEVAPFFESRGFTTIALASAEGIAAGVGPGVQRRVSEAAESDPVLFERMLDLVVETCTEPSILGLAAHLLYFGKK